MSRYFNFLEKASFYLFVFSLPFSLKKIIYSGGSYFYNYQTVFLCLADIFLFLTIFFYLLRKPKINFKRNDFIFLGFLIFCFFGGIFSNLYILSFLKTFRLFTGFLLYLYLKNSDIKLKNVLIVFFSSGIFQGVLALVQFYNQKNLNLRFLGEPIFSPLVLGVAKLKIAGAKIIRPPGTLPHANVLAAFLFFALVCLFYLFLQERNVSLSKKIIFSLSVFILLFSLFLTFSRSGWFVLFLFLIGFSFLVWRLRPKKEILIKISALFLLVIILFFSFAFIFKNFFILRAKVNLKEKAINLRLVYQKMALEIIKQKPFLGVGLGNYINFSSRNNLWSKYGLTQVYLFRPVHNIYLLIASETGLMGLFLFLSFIFLTLVETFKKIKTDSNYLKGAFFVSFACLLVWGFSDHFLFDLTQGIYLFWFNLGLLLIS